MFPRGKRKNKIHKMVNIESIPVSASELGIGFEGYNELARNISRMISIIPEQRQKILERADKELPGNIISKANGLVMDLANDRKVYEIAGLPYHRGPPEGQNLFITAVADYLLRTRSFESRIKN